MLISDWSSDVCSSDLEHAFGVYAGSTIHEVAQVVVAGGAVGEVAGSAAVIEMMLRVMLLAPFLLLLSSRLSRRTDMGDGQTGIVAPWFAVLFIAVAGFNSLQRSEEHTSELQ